MAPTPSPTPSHSSISLFRRHLHRLRHQALGFHHPPARSSASRTEMFKPRTLDPALQPSLVPEGTTPPQFGPTPSQSAMIASEPSAVSVGGGQSQSPNQPEDIPGNIVVAIVVMVLILGGLIGLVVGGEILRREAKTASKRTSSTSSRCTGRRESKFHKNTVAPIEQTTPEKFPYDEKTLTPLARPLPALKRERQRKFSGVWPIRSLSRVLCSRRSSLEQDECSRQQPVPEASPQTTWSEFSPVLLYAASPRTVLARIPEEHEEDRHSEVHRDVGVSKWAHDTFPKALGTPGSSVTTERRDRQGCRNACAAGTKDEDAKSLGSSAPEMTSDGDVSSMVSLESLGESANEEIFELRRVQTTSMQMNKGVLLSFNSKEDGTTHEELECGSSQRPCIGNGAGKDQGIERELSLSMIGGSFSAVNLDEFPSPPSILPVIPSFVSGF